MALLFATVLASLFFFGRSTGVSVAPTATTSYWPSLDTRDFRPGMENCPLFIRMFSVSRMVRLAVLCPMPKSTAGCSRLRYSRQYITVSKTWSSMESGLLTPFARVFSFVGLAGPGTPDHFIEDPAVDAGISAEFFAPQGTY